MTPKSFIALCSIVCLDVLSFAKGHSPVPQGFPNTWNGDRYYKSECQIIQKPPSWVDGYFFAQLSASYGDQSNPEGNKADHTFDAISGLAVFDVSPEKTTFTGAYYPTRSYKIWNLHDRDFAKSSIAWKPSFGKMNASAIKMWEHILPELDDPPPNVDFWKIKNQIIGGTEYYHVGYTFDLQAIDNFRRYPFKETSNLMSGQPLIPMHMPIHERVDSKTNLIWATVSALNISSKPPSLHQVIFTVDQEGLRKVEGIYNFSPWSPAQCQDGQYQKNVEDIFPTYMHSFTSTENYIVLPLTSVAFNPCILLRGSEDPEISRAKMMYKFDPNTPLTFLIFDKRTGKFLPQEIKYREKPQFVSHQFNAYELATEQKLIADMITYENHVYDSLFVDNLLHKREGVAAMPTRFTIDLIDQKIIDNRSILPVDSPLVEFPQFNHNFEGKPYRYAYAITEPYLAGNAIVKIDVDDNSGKNNRFFEPKNHQHIALLEPYFVQKPGTTEEDDGVLISRGYDTSINKTRVYIVEAKAMKQVGEILAPIDTPFGFHERFYLRDQFDFKDEKSKHTEL